jgi:Rhomboid family.
LFPLALTLLLTATGLLGFIAVGTGNYYSYLYTPFCLFSLDCYFEIFTSLLITSSPVVLVVDIVFLYLFTRDSLSFFKWRTLVLLLLIGSIASYFFESLWRIYSGDVKVFIVGSSAGIAAIGGALCAIGFKKRVYIKIGGFIKSYDLNSLVLFTLYAFIHAFTELFIVNSNTSTPVIGLIPGFAAGYSTLVFYEKTLTRETINRVFGASIVLLATTLTAYFTVLTIGKYSFYENTMLTYTSKECEIQYSVLKGFFEGYEKMRTRQEIYLTPLENPESGESKVLKGIWCEPELCHCKR